jgi:hypothetical protein
MRVILLAPVRRTDGARTHKQRNAFRGAEQHCRGTTAAAAMTAWLG